MPALFTPPELPDKLFFSIRELSEMFQVEPSVLRYWETEFSQIVPVQKTGGRRLYRKKDVLLIAEIRYLLYDMGFTCKGARQQLKKRDRARRFLQDAPLESLQRIQQRLQQAAALLERSIGA